jgi:hypothetical protein
MNIAATQERNVTFVNLLGYLVHDSTSKQAQSDS